MLLSKNVKGELDHHINSRAMLERFVRDDESEVIDRVTRLELKRYMAHTLLRDTDAMSMAHSLEVRVPLIDHKLVEFVTTIPAHLKLKNGQPKYLLTESLADILPPEVIARKKQGFEMPVAAWMRGALKPILDDVFSSRSLTQRALFDAHYAQQLYQDFLQGEGAYMRLWCLATLELWMRKYVD
ncbi:MAG: asparagine synthase C-terminal domain-containing protein [Chloroflexi bacterium]|nr:asparagine synthase C-terminal domain-containing protein [Chloroflexota bacterium]